MSDAGRGPTHDDSGGRLVGCLRAAASRVARIVEALQDEDSDFALALAADLEVDFRRGEPYVNAGPRDLLDVASDRRRAEREVIEGNDLEKGAPA